MKRMLFTPVANCARVHALTKTNKPILAFRLNVSNIGTDFFEIACFFSQLLVHQIRNNFT